MWDSIKWLIPNVQTPTWTDGLVALAIVIGGIGIIQFIIKLIVFKLASVLEKREHLVMSDIVKSVYPSLRNALIFTVLVLACSLLLEVRLFNHTKVSMLIDSVYVYFAFKAIYDILGFYLDNPDCFETGKDQDVLTPFFLRMSKVIVMGIALFTIASLWKFNINGFLTAIGLTGVALAFGIRDTLAHIFSGMSVALDKPFQIGDWVMTGDEKIDGIIEDINLRSTLIQTSDKGLVYVPNSYLVNRPIYNLSKRTQRKIEHYLFLSTDNSEEKIVQYVEALREQIALHPKTLKSIIHVAVDEIRPSAYRVLIRYFVHTNDTEEMLQVRQDILFAAKHIGDEYDIVQVDPLQGNFVWND